MIDLERNKIALKIRGALKEKGVFLSHLAQKHEISSAAIQHVINGHRGRTGENAVTIALGFDPWVKWCGKPPEGSGGV